MKIMYEVALIGRGIKEVRNKYNISQTKLVNQYKKEYDTRMDKSLLSKIENGIVPAPQELQTCLNTLILEQCEHLGVRTTESTNISVATGLNDILKLMPFNEWVKTDHIQNITGLDNRSIRRCIARLRKKGHAIVCFQDGKGYMRVKDDISIVYRFVMQERSRILRSIEMIEPMANECRKAGYNV